VNESVQQPAEQPGAPGRAPRLSIILATDTYETVRGVIERFRRQTARQDLELVVVTGCARDVAAVLAFREEFAALQIVEFASTDIAAARAQGIRSATAPIVFIAETHSYAHPTMAEALIGAFDDRWAAVVPALGNANPKGVLSWAAFICDYGIWVTRPAGEIPQAPPHNAAYRRSMLLELQDGLGPALALGGDLPGWMQARNYRTYFEPAARIDHVNVTRFRDWADERFVSGMAIASNRLPHWSLARRLAYVAGSILIPAVLVWRVLPGLRQAARLTRLPAATVPAIVAGAILRAAGEFCAYVGAPAQNAHRQMLEYEMHKLAHLARGQA
jgi:hypothetical protein